MSDRGAEGTPEPPDEARSGSRRRTRRRRLGFGLLTVGAILGAWALGGAPRWPVARVSDGSTWKLVRLSYGTRHSPPGRLLQRLSARLPDVLVQWLNLPRGRVRVVAEPCLGLWFLVQPAPPTTNASSVLLTFADGQGYESEGDLQQVQALPGPAAGGGGGASAPQWVLFTATAFPRDERRCEVRLYEWRGATRQLAGRWPLRGAPRREPAPTPAADVTVGQGAGLEVRLTNLVACGGPPRMLVGFEQGRPASELGRGPGCQLVAQFSVREHDQPALWRVAELRLGDASGNALVPMFATVALAGTLAVHATPTPWSGAQPWRLRLTLERPGPWYPSHERWALPRLVVPSADAMQPVHLKTNLNGATLEVLALVGEHASWPGRPHDVTGGVVLETDVGPLGAGLAFTVLSAHDARRAPLPVQELIARQSYLLVTSAAGEPVDIVLGVTPRPEFEFAARPSLRTSSQTESAPP